MVNRRDWGIGTAAAVAGFLGGTPHASAATPTKETHVYKKVGKLDIKLDVYPFADAKVRPAIVWIHGGALINGHREGVSRRVRRFAFEAGYVLVSIDYRLAPETKLAAIIGDVEDAFQWIHREGPKGFNIDADRIAVAGGSAGGYLTLVSGYRVKPRPQVLLSLWGYGDLIGDWYSKPSPHLRHRSIQVSREEAFRQVGGPPISDARQRKGNGGKFYLYCRQNGRWPREVSGWDPTVEARKFAPFMPVVNVDPNYPPTVMIHGEKDTDVPFEQSKLMAEEFRRRNIRHELFGVANAEHGLPGGDPTAIEKAYRRAFAFVKRELSSATTGKD